MTEKHVRRPKLEEVDKVKREVDKALRQNTLSRFRLHLVNMSKRALEVLEETLKDEKKSKLVKEELDQRYPRGRKKPK